MKSARLGNHTLSTSSSAGLVQTMKSSSLLSIRTIISFLSEIQIIAMLSSKRPLCLNLLSLPHPKKRIGKEEPQQGLHIEPWWPRILQVVDTVEEKDIIS